MRKARCTRTRSRHWSEAAGIAHPPPTSRQLADRQAEQDQHAQNHERQRIKKIVNTIEKQAGILYSSVTGMMVMEFADRGRYIYHDVPKSVYDILKCAPAHVRAQFVSNAGNNLSIIDGIEVY